MTNKFRRNIEPVYCITGIFTLRRDLIEPIRTHVMLDTPLTVDEADMLVYLYGVSKLGWNSFKLDNKGFVAVRDLKKALVHDGGLFSRRMKKLLSKKLIEGKTSERPGKGKRYIMGLRITDRGVKLLKPIWQRYCQLAETICAGLSDKDLKTYQLIHQHLSTTIRKL